VIKDALEKANIRADEVDIFLFHQANSKMLEAITKNMVELFGVSDF
jgi:3-oxoacyl-[acyl-carrier-protein] synthase-3